MTKAKIKRLIDAAIEAARKQRTTLVVEIDGAIIRVPPTPDDKPIAVSAVANDNDDWSS
jgi:hypothetical protein